jgi:hypothetical protein
MPQLYRPSGFDTKQFYGQFILTAEKKKAPEGWSVNEFNQWRLYTLQLPVINVYDQTSRWLGWCIGHPVVEGQLDVEHIVLRTSATSFDMGGVDEFYQRACGKWALLLLHPDYEQIFLDSYGSLAAVYSTVEKTIASTPSLVGTDQDWDEAFIRAIGLPEKDRWLPSGLTTKKNVWRLLPNHNLNLSNWKASRHWPQAETDLSVDPDTEAAVIKITGIVTSTIAAVAKKYPMCLTITAGRDSRAVLACAYDYVNDTSFFTFEPDAQTPDMQIPALLVQRLKLNHRFIRPVEASAEELEQWLALTGWSVSGKIWKIHKTLKSLDSKRVLLPGTSAEVHKGVYWRSKDRPDMKLTAAEVLTRCKLPHHPAFIEATEAWLQELHFLDAFNILDLVHLEQRLACWAGPQHYGNTISAFEMAVYNSRPIFHTMMRLPRPYRQKKQLAIDIIRHKWPELLNYPFNQFMGLKGMVYSTKDRIKKFLKELL